MDVRDEIIKMLEEHHAHRTYISDIRNTMRMRGFENSEISDGFDYLEEIGAIERDIIKYKLKDD